MPAREDGEYELILGNKQLLGVLFIVIVLLGVFFAMGFLAGRSTSPMVAATEPGGRDLISIDPANERSPAAKQIDPPKVLEPEVREVAPPAKTSKPEPAAEAPRTPSTPPMTPTAPQVTAGGAGSYQRQIEEAADPAQLPAPPQGNYLQVAATSLRDAQGMLALLKKNGHQGALTPVPNRPGLVRVLVGPLPSKEATAQTRESLRELGIESPIPQTYK